MKHTPPGARIRSVRKRRGMTQRELAGASGVSLSWLKKIEEAASEGISPRVETVHRIAQALKVPTSTLISRDPPDDADQQTAGDWQDVRAALFGQVPQPDETPSTRGILEALAAVQPDLAANRFTAARAVLPGLIRDAAALNGEGHKAQSRVLNLAAWLLTMTRQWEPAAVAARLSADAAGDRLDAAAAVNTACWSLLRQGKLAEGRDLATRWADEIEPRFSRATARELALWGRLLLGVSNAAVRDNRPGEAADALSLARSAAGRVGREITADGSTTRTFGPASVAMIAAENAAIQRRPDRVLAISAAIPQDVLHPSSASRCRHRLDIANAYVVLRRYPEAMGVLRDLRLSVPEWLVQQRYARDILAAMIEQRTTLTAEMRDLADAVGLPL